ncbi:ARPP-1 family domain-containing protein [Thermosynechococcus sp. TG252]|uniref:ARPP-1 family domain-containing protein n=1 Tax=Thermosynechococcus sp. TG252 TaxID=3074097 RepID=UPI00285A5730|nr:DUF6569 family protein [Thermosynechococcus sp. TG252]MDR7992660.1 hypothetical protein [Thermosynechococcus sp. TG252]
MNLLQELLQTVEISTPQTFGGMTLFPLLRPIAAEPDYWTLTEAMNQNLLKITEVSEGGHVPELLCHNWSDRSVLLVDGEELVGAKQNRILNLTVLVPAHTDLKIPVSCVERGRWHYRCREFAAADRAYHATGRAKKLRYVTESLKRRGSRLADQGEIWADVDDHLLFFACKSATDALADVYEKEAHSLDEYVQAFRAIAQQIGALFVVHGQILGLELFDFPATFGKLLPKFSRSYGLEALKPSLSHGSEVTTADAKAFLTTVAAATAETFEALAEGTDVRLTHPEVIGSALVAKERVVHLSAFPTEITQSKRRRSGWEI